MIGSTVFENTNPYYKFIIVPAGQPKFIRDDNMEERAFKRYKRSQEKGDYSLVNALDEHGERY